MSHRIDIELTSQSDAGWTWRAAGARQPKGTLDPSLVYSGAKVGDVVRAEAERELEGTRIVSLTPPKGLKQTAERIELVERAPSGPSVNVVYAEKSGGRGRDGERRGPRPDRGDRPDRPRGERPTGDRPPRSPRPDRPAGDRPPRTDRPVSARGPRPDRPATVDRRPKRLAPSRVHRDAFINSLDPEQRPVAEQLFRGGIPAVRQAIIDQNAQLKAAGQTEVPSGPLLAMAEDLVARTRQAEWLDKAEAALAAEDGVTLRDLRAVVTQSDGIAKDESARAMVAKLREALNGRVEAERTNWVKDIEASLADDKLVRAVRLSARIPDPGAKLSAELTAQLVSATNASLSTATPADRWAALVEAAAEAPFRRDIVPAGLPAAPSESLLATAAQASNRIPALLKLLGLTIPPPPKAKAGARPLPPPPPKIAAPAVVATSVIETPAAPVVADTPVAEIPAAETLAAEVVFDTEPAAGTGISEEGVAQ
jgi:hypothetical protein